MRTLTLTIATAVLSACATEDGLGMSAGNSMAANDSMPLRGFFQCEGGKAFTAQYFGRDRAVITTSGQNRFELPRVQGEGNAYSDGTVSFSTDLTTATLTGTPLDPWTGCRVQS